MRQLEDVLEMSKTAQTQVLPSDVAQMAIDLALTTEALNNVLSFSDSRILSLCLNDSHSLFYTSILSVPV
jgi:glutamine synthetase adenylyltransferase